MGSISVVIPTHNRGELLVEAVRSVLEAGVADEVIIADGSSDDGSVERAASLGELIVLRRPRANAAATRNAGWRAAGGEYIAFLDSDDLMLPEKVTCLAPLLETGPRIGLAHGRTRVIEAHGRADEVRSREHMRTIAAAEAIGTSYEALAHTCVMYTSATLIRRAALEDVGGYDESLDVYEDWDLYLRLSREWQLVYADCVTANYRVWPGNVDWRRTAEWTVRVARRHLVALDWLPPERQRAARYAFLRRIAWSSHVLLDRRTARSAAVAAARLRPASLVTDRSVRRPLACSFVPTALLERRRT